MPLPITDPTQVPRFRDAYQLLIDEIRNVPASEFVLINVDIPTAVTTVLEALPELCALRPRIVEELPSFDIERFDKLEAYAMAVAHAHALYIAASQPPEALEHLVEGATDLREMLLSDATALAERDFFDLERLRQLKGARGYRNLALDLFALAALMRELWPQVAGKTALQLNELDQAETLAGRILTAVGQDEQGPIILAASAENRLRAFSLFVGAYDHVRRAVSYLRWEEDDAEDVAPSLYTAASASRRKRAHEVLPPPLPLEIPLKPINGAPVLAVGVGMSDSEPFATQ